MRSRRLMAATFAVVLTLGVVACEEVAVEDVEDPLTEDPSNEDPADGEATEETTY